MAVLHKLMPRSRRLTAEETAVRLESSPLYQRREMAARHATDTAKRAALWYLSKGYSDRYLPMKESR